MTDTQHGAITFMFAMNSATFLPTLAVLTMSIALIASIMNAMNCAASRKRCKSGRPTITRRAAAGRDCGANGVFGKSAGAGRA